MFLYFIYTSLCFGATTDVIIISGVVEPKPVDVGPIVMAISSPDPMSTDSGNVMQPLFNYKSKPTPDVLTYEPFPIYSGDFLLQTHTHDTSEQRFTGSTIIHRETEPCDITVYSLDGTTTIEKAVCVKVWDE